jgi:ATP-dependent Lon protease
VADAHLLNATPENTGRGAPAQAPIPPDALVIVPVRDIVLFPGTVLPITLGRPRSIAAAQQAVRDQRQVGVVMQRSADVEDPAPIDLHRMGTVANIVRYITAPDGTHHLVCQGEQRFQITEFLNGWPFFVARVLRITEPQTHSPEIEARFLHLKNQALEAVQLLPQTAAELLAAFQSITAPGALADLAVTYMDVTPAEKQEVLETIDIVARKMPPEVEQQARKELRRLERMPDASAEYGMVRTYLDWLNELPWSLPEPTPIDIKEARRILDEDHYGLEKIKRRIIEYLAVRKLAPQGKAPILCSAHPAWARLPSASRSPVP